MKIKIDIFDHKFLKNFFGTEYKPGEILFITKNKDPKRLIHYPPKYRWQYYGMLLALSEDREHYLSLFYESNN